jgi:hypothetical protein
VPTAKETARKGALTSRRLSCTAHPQPVRLAPSLLRVNLVAVRSCRGRQHRAHHPPHMIRCLTLRLQPFIEFAHMEKEK